MIAQPISTRRSGGDNASSSSTASLTVVIHHFEYLQPLFCMIQAKLKELYQVICSWRVSIPDFNISSLALALWTIRSNLLYGNQFSLCSINNTIRAESIPLCYCFACVRHEKEFLHFNVIYSNPNMLQALYVSSVPVFYLVISVTRLKKTRYRQQWTSRIFSRNRNRCQASRVVGAEQILQKVRSTVSILVGGINCYIGHVVIGWDVMLVFLVFRFPISAIFRFKQPAKCKSY